LTRRTSEREYREVIRVNRSQAKAALRICSKRIRIVFAERHAARVRPIANDAVDNSAAKSVAGTQGDVLGGICRAEFAVAVVEFLKRESKNAS